MNGTMSAVAYVTITLHSIRVCEYCPHLSSICAVREMRNTKLKQTLLSSVQIDPYTKQAVFTVNIVRSYTRRLVAFSKH